MRLLKKAMLGVVITAVIGSAGVAHAENKVRWGLTADAASMDPQGRLAATEFIFLRQMYEGLTTTNSALEVLPALAESWENPEPTLWRFKLREGVKFHEGQDFTAEDVVFTIGRANAETSAFKVFGSAIDTVKAVDDHTVEIRTKAPDPLFLSNLASVFIMDSGWAKEHGIENAPNAKTPEKYYSDNAANGTGAYRLTERKTDVMSVLTRNKDWWGTGKSEFPGNVDVVEARPIGNSATRVASLLSGELDLVTEVPMADIARVEKDERFKVEAAPQLRVIFLGYNYLKDKLDSSNAEGNPFKELKVRQAINLALDADLIKDRIMRGQSAPTSILTPPGLAGYSADAAKRPAVDQEKAKALLAEAGYPEGFSVRLDCPNNRYVNDEAICQAAVSMLAKVGIKITLNALPKDQWSGLVTGKKSDFYMLGFGTPTNDSHFIAGHLLLGGPFHNGYANEKVAELMAQAGKEMDSDKRNETMAEVFAVARDDAAYAPLHYQMVTWGMGKQLDIPVDPNNLPDFRAAVMK